MSHTHVSHHVLLIRRVSYRTHFSPGRALGGILLSSEFAEAGGWLAPPTVDPEQMSATLGFAANCASLWVAGGSLSGAFTAAARDSPVAATARVCVASACVYLLVAFGGALWFETCIDPFCADASLWEKTERIPLSVLEGVIGLALTLVAWRAAIFS